jgi:glutathionyl-hydroquinone reductase
VKPYKCNIKRVKSYSKIFLLQKELYTIISNPSLLNIKMNTSFYFLSYEDTST